MLHLTFSNTLGVLVLVWPVFFSTDTCVIDGKPYMQCQVLQPLVCVGRCYANYVCGRWDTTVTDVMAKQLFG